MATFKHHAIMFTLRIAAVEDGLLASSVVPAAKQLVTGYKNWSQSSNVGGGAPHIISYISCNVFYQ